MRKKLKAGVIALTAAALMAMSPAAALADTIIIPVNPDGTQQTQAAQPETQAPPETSAVIYAPTQDQGQQSQGPGMSEGPGAVLGNDGMPQQPVQEVQPLQPAGDDGVALLDPSGNPGGGTTAVSGGVQPAGSIDQAYQVQSFFN